MKHLPEDEEKYVDLLVAKTKVLRNVVILLTLVLVITLVGPNNLKLSFDSSEKNAAEYTAEQAHQENEIVNGVHTPTGLIANEGYEIVAAQCGACHSLKLVTQNKANREGWVSIIQWMQETQNLWDLGENEAKIIDYLVKNYSPSNKGRRQNLTEIEWYELE